MVTRPMEDQSRSPEHGIVERIEVIDRDLAIMDAHAEQLAAAETQVQDEMRRWDREYKDERLHSVPRPRKHLR